MKKNKGKNINSLSRLLESLKRAVTDDLKDVNLARSSFDKLKDFLLRIDNKELLTLKDVMDTYDNLKNIIVVLDFMDFENTDYYDEVVTKRFDSIISSIDLYNPLTVNAKKVSYNNILAMGREKALEHFNDALYVLDRDELEAFGIMASGFLYKDYYKRELDLFVKKLNELQQTLNDVNNTYNNHKMISDDMKEYFIERLDDIYADWRDQWNIEEPIDAYNRNIIEQENKAKEAQALKQKNKEIEAAQKEEEVKLSNGMKNRIAELTIFYDLNRINDMKLTEEEKNIIIKYTDITDLSVMEDNIKELDTLLSYDIKDLDRILCGYTNNRLNTYLNLLIRTYIVKNMMPNLLFLLKIIPNIEMKKFDAADYLKSQGRKCEVELVNNFKQLIYIYNYLDSEQNDNELLKIESNYNGLTLLVYYYSIGLFSEEEYLKELEQYKVILENHLSLISNEPEDIKEAESIVDYRKNTMILLTDKDDISYVEKNILSDIRNVNDQAIAFDRITRLENIDVHNDIEGHICMNNIYKQKQDLLKRFHFKSANFNNSRIYYGCFTNDKREKLVIIYGIRTGNMDNNSKTRYYKEVINNQVLPSEDYINGLIEAFNNDSAHFEKYVAKSEAAKDHFKETLKENGYKFENVNTLEIE